MSWVDSSTISSDYEERRNTETNQVQHRKRGAEHWLDGSAFDAELQDVSDDIEKGARWSTHRFQP